MSLPCHFHPMGPSLLLGQRIAQSSCGMLRHGQISPRLKGIQMRSLPCHFRPMGPFSLLGQRMTQSSCGMLSRGQILPRLKDMGVTSIPCHFRPMGVPSLLGPGMIQSSYGMLSRGQTSPRLKGIGVTSLPCHFRRWGHSRFWGRVMGSHNQTLGCCYGDKHRHAYGAWEWRQFRVIFTRWGHSRFWVPGMIQSSCGICRCILPLLRQPLHPTLMAMELLALPIFCSLSNSLDSVGVLRDMKRDLIWMAMV